MRIRWIFPAQKNIFPAQGNKAYPFRELTLPVIALSREPEVTMKPALFTEETLKLSSGVISILTFSADYCSSIVFIQTEKSVPLKTNPHEKNDSICC